MNKFRKHILSEVFTTNVSIVILMGKRELVALLNLFSWCLVMVERLFLTVPRGCLRFVIVVFPDHTHLLFLTIFYNTLHYLFTELKFVCVDALYPRQQLFSHDETLPELNQYNTKDTTHCLL